MIEMNIQQWLQSVNPPKPVKKRSYKKRGSSRPAPEGMWIDDGDNLRFTSEQTPPMTREGKSWFTVQVVRVVVDGKGEIIRKNKQLASVFAKESEALGFGIRRCPDPWPGQEPKPDTKISIWRGVNERG